MPNQAPLHRPWRTCGRRERETDAGSLLERSSWRLRLRCGERHPDRQDAVVLRGMAVERRSRPARLRSEWVSPLSSERAGDKGCPLDAEEGNVLSACATKATQPFERQLSLLTRSVTRPSLGPRARARRSSLTSPVKADEGDAFGEGSRLGKPGNRRNQHRHSVARTKRGSTRIPSLARGPQGMRQKRKEVAASVPSRISRVPVGVPARRNAVAEVGRRRSVPNKLAIRPPKRGPARVNGGLARSGRRR